MPSPLLGIDGLQKLDLSQNKLVTIVNIGNLYNLTHLDLSSNMLDFLSDDICNLTKLKELNLSGNKLTTRGLPLKLFDLNISKLDLSGNRLAPMPLELSQGLIGVQVILIHDNPWEAPELTNIEAGMPQEEIKAILSDWNDSLKSIVNDETQLKKKGPAESVGMFLAEKLNFGKSRSNSESDPKEKSDLKRKISVQSKLKSESPDTKEASPENFSRTRAMSIKSSAPLEKEPSVKAPSLLERAFSLKSKGKDNGSPTKENASATKHSEIAELEVPDSNTPSEEPIAAPIPIPEVQVPARTAAPLKTASRAQGPKGRKVPSAGFIAQSIQNSGK